MQRQTNRWSGQYSAEECERIRSDVLANCERDILAMPLSNREVLSSCQHKSTQRSIELAPELLDMPLRSSRTFCVNWVLGVDSPDIQCRQPQQHDYECN